MARMGKDGVQAASETESTSPSPGSSLGRTIRDVSNRTFSCSCSKNVDRDIDYRHISKMGDSECTPVWIGFAFVTAVMIISLLKNILYYLQEKKRGKPYKDVPEYSPSLGEFYTEECPVYDNLNHHQQDILNESYYEQMNAHSRTPSNQVQPSAERQMCYASLDHSVKRKHKQLQKKKYPLEADEGQLTRSCCSMPSDTCIYLNSEQLIIENVSEDSSCQ